METPYKRVMKKVEKTTTGCWTFKGSTTRGGYGKIRAKHLDGKYHSEQAHRVVFEEHFGPIPKGLHVCHTCDNPPCCNPAHLFLGTNKDNMLDRKRKGRTFISWGSRSGHCKLSSNQVKSIRQDSRGPTELASVYGVAKSTISEIKNRKSRKYE